LSYKAIFVSDLQSVK